LFGQDGGVREAQRLGVPLLAQVPIDVETRVRGDTGMPVALLDPSDHPVAAAFHRAAAAIADTLKKS
jgi:ATP-binding protein involved in chromosome partitioning